MERNLESTLAGHKKRVLDFYEYLKNVSHEDELSAVLFKNGYNPEKLIELRMAVFYLSEMIK